MVSERRTVTMKLGVARRSCWRSRPSTERTGSPPTALCCDWCSKRLVEGQRAVQALQEERVKVMNGTNPQYVLRNYITQNTIESAENGDFSEVQRLLKVLENTFSTQPGLEQLSWLDQGVVEEQGEMEQQVAEAAASQMCVPYDSKPPSLGQ
ncbi:unnamed protein product [Oncorhynchus mykiss]|uniref:Selenoprotein O n=1 Tax=Oncorhynchus mykiss TaxID=8022 RepID=A0A060XAF5_ONCMY|nr:unnamed protein product [Oncorhynchus mykiss]